MVHAKYGDRVGYRQSQPGPYPPTIEKGKSFLLPRKRLPQSSQSIQMKKIPPPGPPAHSDNQNCRIGGYIKQNSECVEYSGQQVHNTDATGSRREKYVAGFYYLIRY